ncbi:xylulokinase [Microcella alkaliphila]|uniref:Xylulose kinase n=1 Tax=Microcella alkaliphila TaxID=279828 RepID=A0A4Q7TGE5_9MICO|nr:FGGY family carbohydrate kinase [Microcella alkaliphila]RZT59546.1 xylulokinase [Microcella alkaliphila]
MTLVAGVDSSTQSCKILIVDAETGATVREGRAAHPEGTEVDPAAWWAALRAAASDAGGLADVAAIAIGGQQHGMVVLDAQGRVIRDALLWNDTRSAAAATDLIEEVGAEEYARRVGVVPVASFTATKLRWLRDAEPDHAARVAAVALPHDWLTWRLRGYGPEGESPLGPALDELVTDRSDASGTAYFSAATDEYDLDLFERALGRPARVADPARVHTSERVNNSGQSDAVVLPRVLGPGDSVAVDASSPELLTVPVGTVVGAGAGDNAAAALGLGAGQGDVVVSIGTSGTVFAVSAEPVADASGTVAGFADAGGAHLPLVATLNAARVLDVIARLLGVDHDGLAELALAAEPGADGLVLQPYFEGERTPNLPDATATLFGLTLASTTRESLARAAIEGMLCGLADGLDAITGLGVPATSTHLVGGAARSRAVGAIAAQVLGLPITIPEPGEYVARGAAVQAAWALSGTRPLWPIATFAELPADPYPVIREQYAAQG